MFRVVNDAAKVMCRGAEGNICSKAVGCPGRDRHLAELEFGIWVGGVTANIFHMDASYFGTERTKNPEAEVGSVDSG